MKSYTVFLLILANFLALARSNHVQSMSPNAQYQHAIRKGGSGLITKKRIDLSSAISLESLSESSEPRGRLGCLLEIALIVRNAKRGVEWAQKYLDSEAAKPSGFMAGDFRWFGDFDQCRNIEPVKLVGKFAISPKYYRLEIGPPNDTFAQQTVDGWVQFVVGLCVPSTCQIDQLASLINPRIANLSLVVNKRASYRFDDDLPYTPVQIATITIFSTLALILLMALVIDLGVRLQTWYMERQGVQVKLSPEPEMLITLAQCISPYSNFRKIMAFPPWTDPKKSKKVPNLDAVYGIRSLSTLYIILGHTVVTIGIICDNLNELAQMQMRPSFMLIAAGTRYGVDTFFFLSGFFAYWSLVKQIKPKPIIAFFKQIPVIYFHRYIRLTPPYLAILLIMMGIWAHLSTGPIYYHLPDQSCEANWWVNLLYLNNFLGLEHVCMEWTWYLAADMQMYLFVPFVIYLFVWKPRLGWVACFGALLIQIILAFALTFVYNIPAIVPAVVTNATLEAAPNNAAYTEVIYNKFYLRHAPYVIGVMCARLLLNNASWLKKNVFDKIWLSALMWFLMFGIILSVTYAQHPAYIGTYVDPLIVSAIYHSFARMAWGAAIGWLVLACALNKAGLIGEILSWPFFAVTARLSYMAYIIHPPILIFYNQTSRRPFHGTDLTISFYFCAIALLSFALAIPYSLAFEAPFVSLQQLLIKGKPKKPTVSSQKEENVIPVEKPPDSSNNEELNKPNENTITSL